MNEDDILRHTSRSFYLTIRWLPRAVRSDVALAYLLARATDTVADTSSAAPAARLELLQSARDSRERPEITGFRPEEWVRHQRDPAEQALLAAWPAWWRRMHERDDDSRRLLTTVLGHILEGQIFDLERFGPEAPPLAPEEVERYTWLVAGSVGEFWTDLCAARLRDFATAPVEVMRSRARRYGQALQLVNILRDRRMDAALGRVYVAPEAVEPWTAKARLWLGEGAAYAAALRSGRLRYATVLPALLGWRTLVCVAEQAEGTLTPAKVPRVEWRRWLRRALPVWWSPQAVLRLARAASE